ncbi:MAG: CsbD family protein [Paracoccaceae bacterium]
MNWDTIEGGWKQARGRAQAKWGDITGDDWASIAGRRDEIVGLVQKRYGHAHDAAEQEVDSWFRGL